MNIREVLMKKGFTLIEVSILFVIFIIVAFLVAPMSLDDTIQANNTSKWRSVQADFVNIFHSINTQKEQGNPDFVSAFDSIIKNEVKSYVKPYKILPVSFQSRRTEAVSEVVREHLTTEELTCLW